MSKCKLVFNDGYIDHSVDLVTLVAVANRCAFNTNLGFKLRHVQVVWSSAALVSDDTVLDDVESFRTSAVRKHGIIVHAINQDWKTTATQVLIAKDLGGFDAFFKTFGEVEVVRVLVEEETVPSVRLFNVHNDEIDPIA